MKDDERQRMILGQKETKKELNGLQRGGFSTEHESI